MQNPKTLENQFIYPSPKGSKLIFFAPPGVGVNEEPTKRSEELDEIKIKYILNIPDTSPKYIIIEL